LLEVPRNGARLQELLVFGFLGNQAHRLHAAVNLAQIIGWAGLIGKIVGVLPIKSLLQKFLIGRI